MDKYEQIRTLGEGGYGKAILVRRRADGVLFVMKEIRLSALSPKDREEAMQEANLLSNLHHPFIVSFQECFQERGCFYIVMEYADGGDLAQKIKSRGTKLFSEEEILKDFIQLALAVKYIHDKKILHRDLKVQNVFLMKDGTVKLGDFGIARVLEHTFQLCKTQIGSPYYLSPEICEGKPYDAKTDIWSLGCILYELCTLKHAFTAANMNALLMNILRGKYNPIPPTFSNEMKQLVGRMLTKDSRNRPSIRAILSTPLIRNKLSLYLNEANAEGQKSNPKVLQKSQSEKSHKANINISPAQQRVFQDEKQRKLAKQEECENEVLAIIEKRQQDRLQRLQDVKTQLDTRGKIRHDAYQEAKKVAIVNKNKHRNGCIFMEDLPNPNFAQDSTNIDISDSYVRMAKKEQPKWAGGGVKKDTPGIVAPNVQPMKGRPQSKRIVEIDNSIDKSILTNLDSSKLKRRFSNPNGASNFSSPRSGISAQKSLENTPTLTKPKSVASSKCNSPQRTVKFSGENDWQRMFNQQKKENELNAKRIEQITKPILPIVLDGSRKRIAEQRLEIEKKRMKMEALANGSTSFDGDDLFDQMRNDVNEELDMDPTLQEVDYLVKKKLDEANMLLSRSSSQDIYESRQSDISPPRFPYDSPKKRTPMAKEQPVSDSVSAARQHLTHIQSLAGSIRDLLTDDFVDEPSEPVVVSNTKNTIYYKNKELNFPVVNDNDSLSYRAEAIRAFLERELGIDKLIQLQQQILNQDRNPFDIVDDVEPGLIILTQQLLILDEMLVNL